MRAAAEQHVAAFMDTSDSARVDWSESLICEGQPCSRHLLREFLWI